MKRIAKKALSLLLVITMVAGTFLSNVGTTAYAEEKYIDTLGGDPQKAIIDATNAIVSALEKLGASPEAQASFSGIMKRMSGGIGLAGGVVSMLYVFGVLQDPTTEALKDLKSILVQQTEQLSQLSKDVKQISDKLATKEARDICNRRATDANNNITWWKNYEDKLNTMKERQDAFETRINFGIVDWSEKGNSRTDIYSYFTEIKDQGSISTPQTYSTKKDKDLTTSDSNETIVKEKTIGLPVAYVNTALTGFEYNQTTYREDLITRLTGAVESAITDDELICSNEFKTEWGKLSPEGKADKAKEVATGLLNAALYDVAFNEVNGDRFGVTWISEIVSSANVLINDAVKARSGIATLINPIVLTSCFEGEVKDQIEKTYAGFTVIIAEYAMFATTIGSMCKSIDQQRNKTNYNNWVAATNKFTDLRKTLLTGKDNFCYLTNTCVDYGSYKVSGTSYIVVSDGEYFSTPNSRYESDGNEKYALYDSDGKKVDSITTPGAENLYAMKMTYCQKYGVAMDASDSGSKYVDFLRKYMLWFPSTFSDSFVGNVVLSDKTERNNFVLTERIPMNTYLASRLNKPNYFTNGGITNVMSNSKRYDYTNLHDQVQAETFNPFTNRLSTRDRLVSRAMYVESHNRWYYDETWNFAEVGTNQSISLESVSGWGNPLKYILNSSKDLSALITFAVKNDYAPQYADYSFEDEYNPSEFLESIASESYFAVEYNEQKDVALLDLEDWQEMDLNNLNKSDSKEKEREYFETYLDGFVKQMNEDGKNVTLTDEEKTAIIESVMTLVDNADKGIEANGSLKNSSYIDPFGIYDDEEAMTKLAKLVLPDTEIADNGEPIIPTENMITSVIYEPYIRFGIEENGEGYEVVPLLVYDVTPVLLTWDAELDELNSVVISDEAIQELGLTAKIRFNANDAEDNNVATITHYDDEYTMNVVEELTADIVGEGNDRYAEVAVTSCSPFAVSYSKVESGNTGSATSGTGRTGDDTNVLPFIIIAGVAIFGAGCAIVVKRKKDD